MAGTIPELTSLPTSDRTTNLVEVCDPNGNASYKATPNFLLGITGAPVGTTDTQVMTNKTLTAPAISSPTFSGTLTGTYVIGGTPTFPASIATLTGVQTFTNKTLTSPTITSPTITNASITADAISGFTAANSGTIYGMPITNSAIPNSALPTGTVVQLGATNFSSLATGTTLIPLDDTIPQNTEGDQYMTISFTPKSATNVLVIRSVIWLSNSGANATIITALFQDANVNAIATGVEFEATGTAMHGIPMFHTMVAGTTSAITFKVRAGANVAGTMTFNGGGGTRYFGTATKSYIEVVEYKV